MCGLFSWLLFISSVIFVQWSKSWLWSGQSFNTVAYASVLFGCNLSWCYAKLKKKLLYVLYEMASQQYDVFATIQVFLNNHFLCSPKASLSYTKMKSVHFPVDLLTNSLIRREILLRFIVECHLSQESASHSLYHFEQN